MSEQRIIETEKTQSWRLWDVAVLAPALIYFGTRRELQPWMRTAIILTGIATAVSAGYAYMENKKKIENVV